MIIELHCIYERLHVTLIDRGESFYQPLMPKVVEDLEKRGIYKLCLLYPVLYTVVAIIVIVVKVL